MIHLLTDIRESILPQIDDTIIIRKKVPLDEGIQILKERGYHSCLGNTDVQLIRAFKAKTNFHLISGEPLTRPIDVEDSILILHTNLPPLYMRTEYTRKELGNAEFWFYIYEFTDEKEFRELAEEDLQSHFYEDIDTSGIGTCEE